MAPREPISLADSDRIAEERFRPGELLSVPGVVQVEFETGYAPPTRRSDAEADAVGALLQQHDLQDTYSRHESLRESGDESKAVLWSPPRRNIWLLCFPTKEDVTAISEELRRLPQVVDATPEPCPHPATPFDEELLGSTDAPMVIKDGIQNQWYIYRCGIDRVWKDDKLSGEGVIIADIDWGFRTTHVDIESKIASGRTHNSYDGSTDIAFGGRTYHGTAVAGLAVAGDNDVGMAGVAYGATLWAIQANHGAKANFKGNSWANAIDWVRAQPAPGQRKIIILEVQTNGLRNYEEDMVINQAVRDAVAENIVVCVPAGNGTFNAGYTAGGALIPDTGSILIAATEPSGKKINRRTATSNYSRDRITVSAPGSPSQDVTCSAQTDVKYWNRFGGTSGAAPKVAGVIALMLQENPSLTCESIRNILKRGPAIETESDRPVSGGFLDAKRAVEEARKLLPRFELFVRERSGVTSRLEHSGVSPCGQLVPLGADIAGCVAAGHTAGEMVVFGRGAKDGALCSTERTSSGEWGGWHAAGGTAESLAIAARRHGGFDVFATARNRLWHVTRGEERFSEAAGWTEIAESRADITAVVDAEACTRLFGRGADERVWELREVRNGWRTWQPIGDVASVQVSCFRVASNLDSRAEMFAAARDGSLMHIWQTSPDTWSDWKRLHGRTRGFAVVRDYLGRLNAFSIDASGQLQHAMQVCPNSDQWGQWAPIGAAVEMIVGGLNESGRIELFGRAATGALCHIVQQFENGWSLHSPSGVSVERLEIAQMV